MREFSFSTISVLTAVLCLTSMKCADEGTSPIQEVIPGRRDYTWFVDTISIAETLLRSMDGVASNDVWAVSVPGDFRYTIFHFDGTRWSTDGVNRPVAPQGIRVIASNDAWIVGLQGDIWHFDGVGWEADIRVIADSSSFCSLEDIDGDSPTDLYAVGLYFLEGPVSHPLLYHLHSGSWTRCLVADVNCTLFKIKFYALGKALLLGMKNQADINSRDTSKIFAFDGLDLKEIYAGPFTIGGLGDIARVPGGILILKGRELLFSDGAHEQTLLALQDSQFGGSIEARSTKDVFMGMLDGIAHYNGTDIQYLYRFSDPSIRCTFMKVFPNAVFVIAQNLRTNVNLIYRGYLQN